MKLCCVLLLLFVSTMAYSSELKTIELRNNKLSLLASPQMGGRLFKLALHEHSNILKVGEDVYSNPQPKLSAHSGNIGYMGHIVWLSPQGQWWRKQSIVKERFENAAMWPPDPFVVQARNKILRKNSRVLQLEGIHSPVSGVRIDKSFELADNNGNSVLLRAKATNIRETELAWGLWFNTRIEADAKVYVPVDDEKAIRMWDPQEGASPLVYAVKEGVLSLDSPPPEKGKSHRNGKLFIKPSAGWMAAFDQQQLLIIQFPLQDHAQIHPEQAQVELYMNYERQKVEQGLIEMELHTPFVSLKKGEATAGEQLWSLFPYEGKDSDLARRSYLKQVLEAL